MISELILHSNPKAGRSEFRLAPYVPNYSPDLIPEMGGLLSQTKRPLVINIPFAKDPELSPTLGHLTLCLDYCNNTQGYTDSSLLPSFCKALNQKGVLLKQNPVEKSYDG
uniref:Uncharacterized protein n=1 Tax=Cucumis melo TaxID=3656 RepID=A0A9I9EG20_CUCME